MGGAFARPHTELRSRPSSRNSVPSRWPMSSRYSGRISTRRLSLPPNRISTKLLVHHHGRKSGGVRQPDEPQHLGRLRLACRSAEEGSPDRQAPFGGQPLGLARLHERLIAPPRRSRTPLRGTQPEPRHTRHGEGEHELDQSLVRSGVMEKMLVEPVCGTQLRPPRRDPRKRGHRGGSTGPLRRRAPTRGSARRDRRAAPSAPPCPRRHFPARG